MVTKTCNNYKERLAKITCPEKTQACCLLGGMVPRVDQNTVIHLGMYHVFAYRTTYTNNMHPHECVLRV